VSPPRACVAKAGDLSPGYFVGQVMDNDQGFFSALSLDDDDPKKVLAGILSPADAQTIEAAPPVAPALSGPGQSTPRTGNLATAPQ
jgi:hypothetical protein